jgi:hypothetical protein
MPLFSSYAYPITATGAVPRTTLARLNDTINVLDFGAIIGDYSPLLDNRAAFTAAFTAAAASWSGSTAGSGGRVYVPRGIYNFTGPLTLPTNSVTLVGESAASTQLVGDFNGYLLDGSATPSTGGGFLIENLKVRNGNLTPFTSGAISLAGRCPTVRACEIGGMVCVNFTGAVAPRIADCMIGFSNFGGTPGLGAIGVLFAGDGGMMENVSGRQLDVVIALSGTGIVIQGCHFEVCRSVIVSGYNAHGLGLGYARGVYVLGISCESPGIMLDVVGPTSGSIGLGGQTHQSAGINPNPGSPYPDRPLWMFRIADGMAENLILGGGGGTSDLVDPTGGFFSIGLPPTGQFRTGGCYFSGCVPSPIPNTFNGAVWKFPGSAGGGAAVAGAANSVRLVNCGITPIWRYDDLPWGTLTGASISNGSGAAGTILTYSAATRLTLEVGSVIGGGTTLPNTKVTALLTSTTATVDKSQLVASGTKTFYCNNPGDEYLISDSVDAIWTGTTSNAGKPAVGGGANQVSVMFKETLPGYTLVG